MNTKAAAGINIGGLSRATFIRTCTYDPVSSGVIVVRHLNLRQQGPRRRVDGPCGASDFADELSPRHFPHDEIRLKPRLDARRIDLRHVDEHAYRVRFAR